MKKALCILLISMMMLMVMPNADNPMNIIEDEQPKEELQPQGHGTRNGAEPDFIITTTSDFDNGTKYNTATETDLANVIPGAIMKNLTAEILKIGTNVGGGQSIGTTGSIEYWGAESFILNESTFITAISFYANSITGTPTDIIIDIRDNVTGDPGPNAIISTESRNYSLVNVGVWNKLNISGNPYKIHGNVSYWLVFRCISTPPNENYYTLPAGSNYLNGHRAYSTNQGSSWTHSEATDFGFRLYTKDYIDTNETIQPTTYPLGQWASIVKVNTTYHMYYGFDSINHATSFNGLTWTADTANNPVISIDSGNWCPWVWKEGDTWYIVFTSNDNSTRYIKKAHSYNGINWTVDCWILKPDAGEWDSTACEIWGLIKVNTTYYLWYNNVYNATREIGLATTTDAPDSWTNTSFTKDSSNPIFHGDGTGIGGRYCNCPFKKDDYFYMLVPHYTNGTNDGEIELYKDINPTFYEGERVFIGVAIQDPDSGWGDIDLDTPFVLTDDIYRDSYNASNGELWVYISGYNTSWRMGTFQESNMDEALGLSGGSWDTLATQKASWQSDTITVPENKELSNITIEYLNISATHYIDEIQFWINNTIKASYGTDITTDTSTTIENGDLTYGSFININEDFTIKLYLKGNSTDSPIITEIYGYFSNETLSSEYTLYNITLYKDYWNFKGYPNATEINVTSLFSEIPNCTCICGKNMSTNYWFTYWPGLLTETWNISFGDGLFILVDVNVTWQVYNHTSSTSILRDKYNPMVYSNPTGSNATTVYSGISNVTSVIGKNATSGYWYTYWPSVGLLENWDVVFGDGLFILTDLNSTWNHN